MNWLLRLVVAILIGAIVTGLLDWAGWLSHGLNVLIGIVVAIVVYLSWDGVNRPV